MTAAWHESEEAGPARQAVWLRVCSLHARAASCWRWCVLAFHHLAARSCPLKRPAARAVCRPGAAYDEVHDVLHKVLQVYVIHLIDSGGWQGWVGRRGGTTLR